NRRMVVRLDGVGEADEKGMGEVVWRVKGEMGGMWVGERCDVRAEGLGVEGSRVGVEGRRWGGGLGNGGRGEGGKVV
ncbi:hypothetical protein, partial [Corynebacterium glyciniphilum]|uniref:hypothetical protein n=1 Tax=Corynebacterium glyciniphilum TaxID=1404244 RepID=UPI001C92EF8C